MLRSIKIKGLNSRTILELVENSRERLVLLLTSQDFYIVNEFSRTNRIVAKRKKKKNKNKKEEREEEQVGRTRTRRECSILNWQHLKSMDKCQLSFTYSSHLPLLLQFSWKREKKRKREIREWEKVFETSLEQNEKGM